MTKKQQIKRFKEGFKYWQQAQLKMPRYDFLHYCRIMLFMHGLIGDRDNERIGTRIEQRVEKPFQKEKARK